MNTTIENEPDFRWSAEELYCGNLHLVTLTKQSPPGEESFVLLEQVQFAPMLILVGRRCWVQGVPFRLKNNGCEKETVEQLYRTVLSELEFNVRVRARPIKAESRQMDKARRHFQWRYGNGDKNFDADEMFRIYCRLWEHAEQNGFDPDTGKPCYQVDLRKEDFLPPDVRKRLDEQKFDDYHIYTELICTCVLSAPLSETLYGCELHQITEPDALLQR